MELDFQSLLGSMSRDVHCYSHWLRPSIPPAFGLIYQGRYWSAKIDDISLKPPLLHFKRANLIFRKEFQSQAFVLIDFINGSEIKERVQRDCLSIVPPRRSLTIHQSNPFLQGQFFSLSFLCCLAHSQNSKRQLFGEECTVSMTKVHKHVTKRLHMQTLVGVFYKHFSTSAHLGIEMFRAWKQLLVGRRVVLVLQTPRGIITGQAVPFFLLTLFTSKRSIPILFLSIGTRICIFRVYIT